MEIAKKIKMIREAYGITQKELSHDLGLKQSVISVIESGAHSSRVDTLDRVLAAFGYRIIIRSETQWKDQSSNTSA